MILEDYAKASLRLIAISSSTSFYEKHLKVILFEQPNPLEALGFRLQSYRPDQL